MSSFPPQYPGYSPGVVPGAPASPPGFTPAGFVPPAPGRRQYGNFAAMILSPFFSGSLYRDVARNWRGIGAWYMFLLLVITAIIVLVKVHVGFRHFARDDFPEFVKTFPPITITDGKVSSPVEQPYTMNDPEKRNVPFLVLDTTGEINSLDDTKARVLVTEKKFFMRDDDGRSVREYDLSGIKSFYVDRAKLTGWMQTLGAWIGPICFPFIVGGPFVYRLLQALVFAAIGLAFSAGFGSRLKYDQLLRLSMIAITPAILLSTIFTLVGVDFRLEWIVYLVMSLGYLLVAVKANAEPAMAM